MTGSPKKEWSWIFERGDKPERVISTIEALAVLMRLKLFYGEEARGTHTRSDNRGSGSALNKLMTNRHPSSAVVMELACYLERMSVKVVVDWAPRTAKPRGGRASEHRIVFQEAEVRCDILPEALQQGRGVGHCGQQARVERGRLLDRTRPQQPRKPEDKMRVRDLW